MMGGELEILLQPVGSDRAARVVRVPVDGWDTVGKLKEAVLASQGLRLGPRCHVALIFSGHELPDDVTLEQSGVRAATGDESWAGDLIYPNGWSIVAHKRATPVASSPSWPPMRASVGLEEGARWLHLPSVPHLVREIFVAAVIPCALLLQASYFL